MVSKPQTVPDVFASAVQRVAEDHDDVASEGFWQDVSKLVTREWATLCREQAPLQTMAMVKQCAEVILRIRRGQQQDKGQSAGDALEEFRAFMNDVVGKDDEA